METFRSSWLLYCCLLYMFCLQTWLRRSYIMLDVDQRQPMGGCHSWGAADQLLACSSICDYDKARRTSCYDEEKAKEKE
jgi:hypothetical protein